MTSMTSRLTRRRHGRRAGAALVAALAAASLSGCASARDSLGTNASPCFDALAIAGDAVHHRGTFDGVAQLSLTQVGRSTHLGDELSSFKSSVHDVCVVAYRGSFGADQVERPLGPPPPGGVGRYAIVIVSKPQNHLVGTVVRRRQALRFGDLL